MVATNYSTVRNNFKGYCDMATDQGETVLVTRKDDRNIVIMSLDAYNAMMKEIRNAQYLAKIDRGFEQIRSGRGQVHELIEVDDDAEDMVG